MNFYLDVCCLNRPFDDQTQEKVHLETEAILIILSSDRWELVGSDIIDFEISKIPDMERKKKVELLALKISNKEKISADLIKRAKIIASAEFLQSDYMIMTDNEIVKKYQKHIEFFKKN